MPGGRRAAMTVVLGALLLSACAGGETVTPVPPTDPVPTPTTAAPVTPTAPPLAWSECGDGLECATLAVPLDYREPQGTQVDLAVARVPSPADEPIGALIVNPGGPGGSGVDFLRDGGLSDLRDSFDLVSWDPRGVGDSERLDCATDTTFFTLDPTPEEPAEKTALENAARDIADACQTADAALVPNLTTATTARDLEQLRLALGGDPLNYFGFSYGTHLGLAYAALFPEQIRTMVLDGVVDPGEPLTEFLIGQAEAIEQVLGDNLDQYRELAARLETAPITTKDDQEVGPGVLGVAAVESVYAPDGQQRLARALRDGLNGDGTALDKMSNDYLNGPSFAGYLGVLCSDGPHPVAGDAWWRFISQITAAAPDFGAGVGNELLPCAYWPISPTEQPGPTQWAATVPPILLVAATGDAPTPLEDAERIHARLPGSVLLVRDGRGHTSYQVSTCVADAVRTYLRALQPPDGGTSCPS